MFLLLGTPGEHEACDTNDQACRSRQAAQPDPGPAAQLAAPQHFGRHGTDGSQQQGRCSKIGDVPHDIEKVHGREGALGFDDAAAEVSRTYPVLRGGLASRNAVNFA